MNEMKGLVGLRVAGLQVGDLVHLPQSWSEGEAALIFHTDLRDAPVMYRAFGDCCSQSRFADITGIQNPIGGVVIRVEVNPLENYNVKDGRTREEYDKAYGWDIYTERGVCSVIMRNSSNGYYGGWIEPYNGSLSGHTILGDAVDLTELEEWSA
jgi:hypothetical protein